MDIGQAKNTRPVEVTELGIKAQVWSQANGLCNFNSIPSPAKLEEFDEDNIQITAGTIGKYMRRTAFFVLGVRDPNNIQGLDPNGNETSINDQFLEGYDIIDGVTFAVTGTKPVDQYSWIRIRHPSRVALEFRLIPKPATTMIRFREGQPSNIYVCCVGVLPCVPSPWAIFTATSSWTLALTLSRLISCTTCLSCRQGCKRCPRLRTAAMSFYGVPRYPCARRRPVPGMAGVT